MTTTCAACGSAWDFEFAFCPRCGTARAIGTAAPVPAAPPPPAVAEAGHEADRRQVTVLFADLTGFTSLAEGLDPETLRAFQNALFAAMAQAVERFDGFVEKFVGDAVMAVFGAPRAHEDDPARAVEAAQDMMQRIVRLSAQWQPRLGRPVTLHIGVHTGAVVAGSLGSGTGGAYAVTGDTVNAASRLLSAAGAGQVLVSDATHALVRHRFAFDAPSELALRGKTEPMRVHGLVGFRADAASARGLSELGLSAPLVGRDEALAALLAAFERMQGGRAQLVGVVGEAGTGKTRLLAELFARLAGDERFARVGVRRAVCSSLGEPAYGVFGALFRSAYEVDAGESLASVRRKVAEGLAALGADPTETGAVVEVVQYLLGIQDAEPPDIDPEQLRRQITMAARVLVERRLAQQPVMLVVDDLQWADAASLDLLGEVIDQLADRPILVLVSQRPGARPLSAAMAEGTSVALGPIEAGDIRALVGHLLGAPGDGELAPVHAFVAARAGGTPLFVEEIVRSLVARGALVREGGRWTCTAPCDDVEVPATLYGLLLSRIDGLGAGDRRVLQEAAVLGAAFDGALLERIASEPPALPASLARLAAADLLRRDASATPGWSFTHALLHEVAYQNLLLSRRTELHRRASLAMEEQLGIRGLAPAGSDPAGALRLSELEALARHWRLSPDKARGARYLLASGDRARAMYANDDAIRHYDQALRTLGEATADGAEAQRALDRLALDARERLADLAALAGRRTDALGGYDAVLRSAEQQGDAVRAARMLRKAGGLHWEAGERDRAGACFDAGLAWLGDGGDAIERAHLYQEMGRLAFRAGDNTTALHWAERALAELPAEGGDRVRDVVAVRAEACNTLGVALARLGRAAEAVEQVECSVAQAEAHRMLQAACRGYTNLGVLYATLDPQRSIETCLRGLETARRVGDLGFQSRIYANLAVAYCALTNRCEAEGLEAAHAAVDLDRRLGLLDHLAVPLIVLGQIHQCHGDPSRAFASYREALQLAEQIDDPQLLFPCYDGLATLYLDAGRPAQAEVFLAKAQAVCERAGLEPDALMVLPFLC